MRHRETHHEHAPAPEAVAQRRAGQDQAREREVVAIDRLLQILQARAQILAQRLVKQPNLAVPLVGANPGVNAEEKWTETIGLMSQYNGLARPGQPSAYWNSTFAAG